MVAFEPRTPKYIHVLTTLRQRIEDPSRKLQVFESSTRHTQCQRPLTSRHAERGPILLSGEIRAHPAVYGGPREHSGNEITFLAAVVAVGKVPSGESPSEPPRRPMPALAPPAGRARAAGERG